MYTLSYLKSKINPVSVFFSVIYGIICVSVTINTPEITSKILYILGFISAVLFYFFMYVLYTNRRYRTWKEVILCIFHTFFYVVFTIIAFSVGTMMLLKINYDEAVEVVTGCLSNILYYIPFIP